MEDRPRELRAALALSFISVAWNGVVGGTAVIVGLATASLSLLGFGVDAAIDSVASVVLIWRFRIESRQPERAHAVEAKAERVVGIALLALAGYLVLASMRSLIAGDHPEPSTAAIAILIASVAVLPPLGIAKRRVAARLGSGALRADATLTLFAAVLAMVGLVSMVLSTAFGGWWGDAVGALVIAVVVAREGWSVTFAGLSVVG